MTKTKCNLGGAREIVFANASECHDCKKPLLSRDDLCKKHLEMWKAADYIDADTARRLDHLHHAPACPANHFEGMRGPHGACNCGAAYAAGELLFFQI